MKKNLKNTELKVVSGGILFQGSDGSYLVCGISDEGRHVHFIKSDFDSAVDCDWNLFKERYMSEKRINSIEELMKHYRAIFAVKIEGNSLLSF